MTDLRKLAEAIEARKNYPPMSFAFDYEYAAFQSAASPDVILALLDVADAVRRLLAMHEWFGATASERDDLAAALARLDALSGGTDA